MNTALNTQKYTTARCTIIYARPVNTKTKRIFASVIL